MAAFGWESFAVREYCIARGNEALLVFYDLPIQSAFGILISFRLPCECNHAIMVANLNVTSARVNTKRQDGRLNGPIVSAAPPCFPLRGSSFFRERRKYETVPSIE